MLRFDNCRTFARRTISLRPVRCISTSSSSSSPVEKASVWIREKLDQASLSNAGRRRSTIFERVVNFTPCSMKLWQECLRYHDINAAMMNPRSAWSGRTRAPRRQLEQQRVLRYDLRGVAPTILGTALPFVGYFPLLLAVVFPQQLLCRQFWNPYERELFACQEYLQRRVHYQKLADYFWAHLHVPALSVQRTILPMIQIGDKQDAAGPILNMDYFRRVFCPTSEDPEPAFAQDLNGLPREHLIAMSLCMCRNQSLPYPWNWILTNVEPTFLLRQYLSQLSRDICVDDDALLADQQVHYKCASLTKEELMDACLLRGLPVIVSSDDMRTCLTNYLAMIQNVKAKLPTAQSRDNPGLQMLVLHLSVLRYQLKHSTEPGTTSKRN